MAVAPARLEDYRPVDELMFTDLGHYCERAITIKDKSGGLVPFHLNRAQLHLHEQLSEQFRTTGQVRALVLKARQLGISTYIAARYYWGVTTRQGRRCYILTHEDKATQNLFAMAKLVHEHVPIDYRPNDTSNNANELDFGGLESGYRVGTAQGTGGSGRSMTIQLFHGSEVAFWNNAADHFAGVMEAVPDAPHTEVVLESTANGVGGTFYDQWQLAERGEGDCIAVFLPWYWDDDYQKLPPAGWAASLDEAEYAETYELDRNQVYWMHAKNIKLGAETGKIGWMFRQEYPANAEEAFQTSGDDSFIPPELVMRARKATRDDQDIHPVVLGMDVARGGGDFTRIIDRQGRQAGTRVNLTLNSDNLMDIADAAANAINDTKAQVMFIDVGGIGAGVYDRLRQLNFGKRVIAINFGAHARDKDRYTNKRNEIWGTMREWLSDEGGADIPDENTLHRHICAPKIGPEHYDSNSRLKLESKKEIKKRLQLSPDGGDALALTFSEPVRIKTETEVLAEWERKIKRRQPSWMSK